MPARPPPTPAPSPRRFPAPWRAVETPGGFRVDDADGQPLAYIYGAERSRGANDQGLSLEEARRVAAWIARSPALVRHRPSS